MKRSLPAPKRFAIAAVACFLLFCGMKTIPGPFIVSIEKDAVLVNNTLVSKDWKTSTMRSVFGKPDTMTGDGHPDAMFDNYGIGIRYFQRKCDELGVYIEELKFYLSSGGDDYDKAHSSFNGLVAISGTAIDSNTTLDQLKKILVGWSSCNAYSTNTYEYMTDTNYIFFEYNTSRDKLLWICVGKRTSLISGCD